MAAPSIQEVSFLIKVINENALASTILSGVLCSIMTYWFFWKGYIMIPHVAKEFATIKESNKNMAAKLESIEKQLDEAHAERKEQREREQEELASLREQLRNLKLKT